MTVATPNLAVRPIRIGRRSRFRVLLLRFFFKPLMALISGSSAKRLVSIQRRTAGRLPERCGSLRVQYRIVNRGPGLVVGDQEERHKLAILYLHGGAFCFPAAPKLQLELLGRLCRDLDAVGFMPDYRLAPLHPAPAALDDCERAYRGLLEMGFAPERIALVGESAGGNLVLGLLQRIRKANLPMPACAVPISPVTELARIYAPPSRIFNARREALLASAFSFDVTRMYVNGQDASDPEISPLYADYAGFPPLYFMVGEREIMLDDSVLAAQQAREAGVDTHLDVWPVLPHAFLLWESSFAEAPQARHDIVAFICECTGQKNPVAGPHAGKGTSMRIERREIDVPGARLIAESQGAGGDVVLVHGVDGDRHSWDWSWTEFAQERRVTRYDLRGFGESVALQPGGFRHSHDLKALLDALGIQSCDLAGVSMGGSIALNFALDFPDRVRRLALISPGMVAWEWSDEWRSAWRPMVEAAQSGDMARARELWWNHPLFATTRAISKAAKKLRETIQSHSGQHWVVDDEQPMLPDVDRLTSLSVPTLLLTGSVDLPDFRLIADLIEAAASNVRRVDYQGAGHLLHLERPQAFLADMIEFLAD